MTYTHSAVNADREAEEKRSERAMMGSPAHPRTQQWAHRQKIAKIEVKSASADLPPDNTSEEVIMANPSGGGGSRDGIEARVARIESDVSYIKRDIDLLQKNVSSIDGRLGKIENGIITMKTTFKASCAIISIVFAVCAYVFGSYVTKILDALNGLVIK